MVNIRKTSGLQENKNQRKHVKSILKYKDKVTSANHKWYKLRKIIGAILLIPVLFYGFAIYKFACPTHFDKSTRPLDNVKITISQVLHNVVDAMKRLRTLDEKLKSLLVEEPLADLIKTKLRPVQERVASLRTQTNQYEKMNKIPGGPKQFIFSAMKELNEYVNEEIIQLGHKVVELMTPYQSRISEVIRATKEVKLHVVDLLRSVQDNIEELFEERIDLIPRESTNDTLHFEIKNGLQLELQFDKLAKLYQQRELVHEKLMSKMFNPKNSFEELRFRSLRFQEQLAEFVRTIDTDEFIDSVGVDTSEVLMEPLPSVSPELVIELLRIQNLIVDEIHKNEKKFEQTLSVSQMYLESISANIHILKTMDDEKRIPYLNLQNMIMTDIKNLQIRITNMQYTYLKVQSYKIYSLSQSLT